MSLHSTLDPKAFGLGIAHSRQLGGHDRATLFSCCASCFQFGPIKRGGLDTKVVMSLRRCTIALPDRQTLPLVRLDEAAATEALQDRPQRPAETERVSDAGIHAVAACGNILVSGISRDKNPPCASALCHKQMRRPGVCDLDLHRDLPAHKPADQRGRIRPVCRICRIAGMERPGIDVILRDKRPID